MSTHKLLPDAPSRCSSCGGGKGSSRSLQTNDDYNGGSVARWLSFDVFLMSMSFSCSGTNLNEHSALSK